MCLVASSVFCKGIAGYRTRRFTSMHPVTPAVVVPPERLIKWGSPQVSMHLSFSACQVLSVSMRYPHFPPCSSAAMAYPPSVGIADNARSDNPRAWVRPLYRSERTGSADNSSWCTPLEISLESEIARLGIETYRVENRPQDPPSGSVVFLDECLHVGGSESQNAPSDSHDLKPLRSNQPTYSSRRIRTIMQRQEIDQLHFG